MKGLNVSISVPPDSDLALSLDSNFESWHAEVNGTDLHYVTGGEGDPIMLLAGWPQTWWAFRKIMAPLAQQFRVIAVDLRGMGSSGKPESGYDKKTMASDVLALAQYLGYEEVDIAGHDVGSLVAYSFAANHPEAAGRIALLDVIHPDESWYQFTVLPRPEQPATMWWFAFNQLQGLPEQLLAGRSRHLIDEMIDSATADPTSIGDFDRDVYAQAYDRPEAIRASNGWYQSLGQDISDEAGYVPLIPPILALTGELTYDWVGSVLPTKALDFELVKLDGAGHYLAEERPGLIVEHFTRFFGS